jgi:aminoglycoside phosphotransferase (APT) family kinase protein
LLSNINVNALQERLMSPRKGIPCHIPRLNHKSITSMMGGMNYHIPLNFDDGVTWICRIRRTNVSSPPLDLQNRIMLSEAATLIYLSRTKIPVPKVHYVAVMTPTNPVGVGYTIMDRLKGAPLPHWDDVPEDKQRHILKQFVDVFVELEKNPFSAIGSLQSPNDLSIGPIVIE